MENKVAIALLAALLVLAFLLPGASANDLYDKRQELFHIQQDIDEGKELLERYEARQQQLNGEIAALESSIERLEQELERLFAQVAITARELEAAKVKLADAETRLAEKEDFLSRRLRATYEMGRVSYLQVILQASSFSDFLTRFTHLLSITEQDKNLLEIAQQERAEIAQKKEALDKIAKRLANIQRNRLDKQNRLEAMTERKQQLLEEVQRLYEEQEENILTMEEEVAGIEEIIKELEEAQGPSGPYYSGRLLWPVPGYTRITSAYGYRTHPITGQPGTFHGGIDIGASTGSLIQAAEGGIAYSYSNPSGYGNYVIIIHGGGLSTLYAHNQRNLVSHGQPVQRGDTIAQIGSTGTSTGPHLHFEVRIDGVRVDPMNALIP